MFIYEDAVKIIAIFPNKKDFLRGKDFIKFHLRKNKFSLKEIISILENQNAYVYYLTKMIDNSKYLENFMVIGSNDNYYLAVFDSESSMRKGQMYCLNNKYVDTDILAKELFNIFKANVIKIKSLWED